MSVFALCCDTFWLLSQQPERGERSSWEEDEETNAKYNRQINKQARRNTQPLVCHTLDSFIPQPLNNKHPSSHKVSFFSRLRNFFPFSLFNNFISCFRREEVLLSLFPVFYFCSILVFPFIRFSLVTLSVSSHSLAPLFPIPLRLKVNVISECRSLEGQNSKSFSPTSVFELKLTFEQQNSSEKI